VGAVSEYLATLDATDRAELARVRDLAVAEAPDATEGTSYGLAALLLGGRPLLGLRAAKGHLSVFPFSPAVVAAVSDRLRGFELSKGTIRFTAAAPLPDEVVRDLVRLRRAELEG
jgi:uncharacterized protein YdhG (YjbR/CyaY superfamily)